MFLRRLNMLSLFYRYLLNREIDFDPFVFLRTARGILRARVFGINTLRVIELFPTFACQCACPMCSVEKYGQREGLGLDGRRILTLDDYRILARDSARLGVTTLVVLGGEPLLFPHLGKLIEIFRNERIFVHLVSNGWAFGRESARSLKRAGLNSIFFSMDSLAAEENDANRGDGHFEKTMANVAACREVKLEVGLAPVFFAGSVEKGLEVVRWCHENSIRASGGQIAPTGAGIESALLSSAELQMIREAVLQYPNFVFDWSFSYFKGIRCPAGKEKVGITMYGDIIPCSYNPIGFGNIFHESLAKILARMGSFSQIKEDYPGCKCSEDPAYIKKFLQPAAMAPQYPIDFRDHPGMSIEKEPALYDTDRVEL